MFSHSAVFYHGVEGIAECVAPFIAEGVARGEPVLVAELPDRVEALSDALGPDADAVTFIDMAEVGRNPACIIPAWIAFVAEFGGRGPLRGVGEPIWAGRRPAELEECRLHESLLNVAFDNGPGWQLMCPYDADALPTAILEDAMRTHPVVEADGERPGGYGGHRFALEEFASSLSPPPADAEEIAFTDGDLAGLRSIVRRLGDQAHLDTDVVDDLTLAAHELACNSIRHGGGRGVIRAWRDPAELVIELADAGRIHNMLVGREPAGRLAESGRGVWMANQLCDLVQVRSSDHGTTVRLHTWL
jgi:anti-sigma regulatory factor (Ser/Thr protein kinase)